MFQFSIVIACKNEEAVIGNTLQALQGLATDVVIYDNGSTDKTIEIVKSFPVNLVQGPWEGFGKTKNKANSYAKHGWILSLDADEIPDDEMKQSLLQLQPADDITVYKFRRKNFIGSKLVRYGEWGHDKPIRLFSCKQAKWNEDEVHERLTFSTGIKVEMLKGSILHYTLRDVYDYKKKMEKYAKLNAEKYFRQGKKGSAWKQWLSPAFSFIQNYIFKLGFLDGRAGIICARINARYTFLKYKNLNEMTDKS